MLRKIFAGLVLGMTMSVALPATVPANHLNKCWGVVSAQRAKVDQGIGEHSSEQSTPRLGLGNVASLFGFGHVGLLGQFLASLDEFEETQCGG
jgi:hypothetical protein